MKPPPLEALRAALAVAEPWKLQQNWLALDVSKARGRLRVWLRDCLAGSWTPLGELDGNDWRGVEELYCAVEAGKRAAKKKPPVRAAVAGAGRERKAGRRR